MAINIEQLRRSKTTKWSNFSSPVCNAGLVITKQYDPVGVEQKVSPTETVTEP